MSIIYQAYVIPSIADEDKLRNAIRESSEKSKSDGILHFHKKDAPCNSVIKPCEKYRNGVRVFNL